MNKPKDMINVGEIKEELFRKMRETVAEYGEIREAILITNYDFIEGQLGGLSHVYASTISTPTLGNTLHKVARFFEDC